MFGFECGDGWYDLMYRLFEKIETYLAAAHPDEAANFDVTQVKEKYGTLRFYHSGSDAIEKFVGEAEDESAKTCETCGQLGRVRSNGWISVRCDQCHLNVTAGKLASEVIHSAEVYDHVVTWGENKGKVIQKIRVAKDKEEELIKCMSDMIAKHIKFDKPPKKEEDV